MDWRLDLPVEPAVLVKTFPTLPIKDEVSQLVGLPVAVSRNTPEACLNSKLVKSVAECIEPLE